MELLLLGRVMIAIASVSGVVLVGAGVVIGVAISPLIGPKNDIGPRRVKDASDARRHLGEGTLEWRPAGPKPYPNVPEDMASAASETSACMWARAHRAASLIARAVIETTARNNGVNKGHLIEMIDHMHGGWPDPSPRA